MDRTRALRFLVFPSLLALATFGCADSDRQNSADEDGYGSGYDEGEGSGITAGASGSDTGGGDGDGAGTGADTGDTGEPPPDDTGDEDSGTTGEPAACDDQTLVELYLSPDDSNSMSSPVQAREAVMSGWSSLSGVPIRTWEFLNYYSFDYPPAQAGELGLHAALLHDPGMEDGEFKFQIGLSSPAVDDTKRAPLNITLVLDQSGSMSGEPMDMLKESARAIAASLRAGDTISMVIWSTENAIVLGGYDVNGPDDPMLLSAINGLETGGGTDLHGGLVAGYDLAMQVYDSSRINRIVLISDGGANVGVTDEELIAEHANLNDQDGIYMVGVGVGSESSYNDLLMDTVTDVGKGASVFIASEQEAWKVFNEDFVNTLAVAARDVQVKLDLPPGYEIVSFSGEEYSTDPEEVEPQHIAPNDAMVFHQSIATCAPELATDDAEVTVTATYKDALTFEQREVSRTYTFAELRDQNTAQLLKGAAVFAYAEALKAERDNENTGAVADALEAIARAEEALPGDADLAEIRDVLEAL